MQFEYIKNIPLNRLKQYQMEYIDIKTACAKYGVSESRIRRIIKDLRHNDLTQLQFERNKNNSEKILISVSHLNRLLNKSTNTINDNNQTGSQDMVAYLISQLAEKDKQINQLHILISQATQLQLEAPKKKRRWWQRKDRT